MGPVGVIIRCGEWVLVDCYSKAKLNWAKIIYYKYIYIVLAQLNTAWPGPTIVSFSLFLFFYHHPAIFNVIQI